MPSKWHRLIDSATLSMEEGQYKEAAQTLEKALVVAEKSGDVFDRFSTLNALGCAHASAGDYDSAKTALSRAMGLHFISDELGPYTFGMSVASLANVHFNLGEDVECRAAALKALDMLTGSNANDKSVVLVPIETLIKLSIRQKAYEETVVLVDDSIRVLNRYSGDKKAMFIETLTKNVAEIPSAIRIKHETKWKLLETN